LLQFFQVMRKSGGGNVEFILNLTGNHSTGMSSKERAHDLQTRLRAEGGKAVGGASYQKRIGASSHISTIAEIQKYVKRGKSERRG